MQLIAINYLTALIEINAFIQQICIQLIKNSKNIYNVTKDS